MKSYLLSLVSVSLVISLTSILSPDGRGNGLARHVRLIAALLLICTLISPMRSLLGGLRALANGELSLPSFELPDRSEQEEELQATLDASSKSYFLQSLTQLLEREFDLDAGTLRCRARWEETDGEARPVQITVLLSGNAIWKDPKPIEQYVRDLLNCECVTAIE